jgi:hypothetical protein
VIPNNWTELVRTDVELARAEQLRVRPEFKNLFGDGLICAGFERDEEKPKYLLFRVADV